MDANSAWIIVPLVVLGLIIGWGCCACICAFCSHGLRMELPGAFQEIGYEGRKRDGFESLAGKTIEVDII